MRACVCAYMRVNVCIRAYMCLCGNELGCKCVLPGRLEDALGYSFLKRRLPTCMFAADMLAG